MGNELDPKFEEARRLATQYVELQFTPVDSGPPFIRGRTLAWREDHNKLLLGRLRELGVQKIADILPLTELSTDILRSLLQMREEREEIASRIERVELEMKLDFIDPFGGYFRPGAIEEVLESRGE